MQKYIFATDPHGAGETWIKRVEAMRDKYPEGKLIFGGDYIDGNPYSRETIEYVRSLTERGEAFALLGNHESLFLNALFSNNPSDPYLWIKNAGGSTLNSFYRRELSMKDMANYKGWRNDLLSKHSDLIGWMKRLPTTLEEDGIVFVHAGFDLSLKNPIDETSDDDRIWIRDDYLYTHGTKTFSHNPLDMTIVTGHTPTLFLDNSYIGDTLLKVDSHCPVVKVKYEGEKPRLFCDGGSKGREFRQGGNIILIDTDGNILDEAPLL